MSCCIFASKLLILDRLLVFSKLKSPGVTSLWATSARFLIIIVVVGNSIGFCCSVASSVFFSMASKPLDYDAAMSDLSTGLQLMSFLVFFETVCLLLIVTAFTIVGVMSARRIGSTLTFLQDSQSNSLKNSSLKAINAPGDAAPNSIKAPSRAITSGRALQNQIVVTCVVVFVSFVLRSMFMTMLALSLSLQNATNHCSNPVKGDRCSKCYNDWTRILVWILFTPEFAFMVFLLSQPVALVVALWGMSSGHTLAIMKLSAQGQRNGSQLST
jgi:hypothetical protein